MGVALDQVTSNVVSIVAELTGVYHSWVTVESVVAVLVDRYSIPRFELLGVGAALDVPVLNLISELNGKLNLFLDTYVATQTQTDGFICFKDCEDGALNILRSFCLPAMGAFDASRASDKNELEIDGELASQPVVKKRKIQLPEAISEYGIGSLQVHPRVSSMFGSLPIENRRSSSTFLGRGDVLTLLLEFQNGGGEITSNSSEIIFNAFVFDAFVQNARKVSLRDAGVRLAVRQPQGSVHLAREIAAAFRHVQAWHTSHIKEWKTRQIDIMQRSAAEQKRVLNSLSTSNAVPILALPPKGCVADFFNTCVKDIERSGPYAPSFTKALASVMKYLQNLHGRNGEGQKTEPESSEKHSSPPPCPSASAIPQLLTEHLMLHVGSSKYRHGKFEARAVVEESDGDATDDAAKLLTSAPSFRISLLQDAETRLSPQEDDSIAPSVSAYESKKNLQNSGSSEIVGSEALGGLCVSAAWATSRSSSGAASLLDMRGVGRWGEALVFQYLLVKYPLATVTWVNKDAESMAYYDIKVEEPSSDGSDRIKTTFVEVKASRFDALNVFEISPNEWQFASGEPHVHFDVYRVYNAGNVDSVYFHIVRDLFKAVTEQKVRLCLAI